MTNSNSTIFDDVFRTMITKMPELIIPLINDLFSTDYPPDIPVTRYQNELFDHHQKKITDSHLGIAHIHYHAECQSTGDPTMHIRMLEYDTAIGLEYISYINGEFHLSLPQSFVLYLSNTSRTVLPSINLHFTNNCSILYHPQPVYLPEYSLEEIFEKDLIFLIPFYIIRYRSKNNKGYLIEDSDDLQELMEEYRSIRQYLTDKLYNKEKEAIYMKIIELSNRIINYIFADNDTVRKGLGDIMGGQVLELEVERLIETSIKQGFEQGVTQGIEEGITQGIEQGIKQGINQERISSIRTIVQILQQQNLSKHNVSSLLCANYQISSEEADNYIAQYWQC